MASQHLARHENKLPSLSTRNKSPPTDAIHISGRDIHGFCTLRGPQTEQQSHVPHMPVSGLTKTQNETIRGTHENLLPIILFCFTSRTWTVGVFRGMRDRWLSASWREIRQEGQLYLGVLFLKGILKMATKLYFWFFFNTIRNRYQLQKDEPPGGSLWCKGPNISHSGYLSLLNMPHPKGNHTCGWLVF